MKKLTFVFLGILLTGCSLPTVKPPKITPPDATPPVACDMMAKLCPDGSAVGRIGPNCEFAPCPGETSDQSQNCINNKGNWLAQYNECEFVSQTWCTQVGGTFNECASACRHNPQAEFCTMQCVPVCQLK